MLALGWLVFGLQARDPKGLYAKAKAGTLTGMTGMSDDAPYEAPLNAEVVLTPRSSSLFHQQAAPVTRKQPPT